MYFAYFICTYCALGSGSRCMICVILFFTLRESKNLLPCENSARFAKPHVRNRESNSDTSGHFLFMIMHIFYIFGTAYSCILWNAYFCILMNICAYLCIFCIYMHMHIMHIYAFAYICIFWVCLHIYLLHFIQAQPGANW